MSNKQDKPKKFTPKFFYIKKTFQYLYAGQTKKPNVFKYRGSGAKWLAHLKKHGIKQPETIVWIWCESPEDFQKCLDYYVPANYVESEEWANSCYETPWDGTTIAGVKLSDKIKETISKTLTGRVFTDSHKEAISKSKIGNKYNLGRKLTDAQKEAISRAQKGHTHSKGRLPSEKNKEAVAKVKAKVYLHVLTGEVAKASSWNPRKDFANQKCFLVEI